MKGDAIEARNLTKRFGISDPVTALDRVCVTLRENEFFTLLGPSGCGKTTLAAADRRLRAAERGRDFLSRRADRGLSAVPPPGQHRVSVATRCFPISRDPEHRVRPGDAPPAARRDRDGGRPDAAWSGWQAWNGGTPGVVRTSSTRGACPGTGRRPGAPARRALSALDLKLRKRDADRGEAPAGERPGSPSSS